MAVSGINFANTATAIAVLTLFIVLFTDDFGWTRAQISAATSIGTILGAIGAPLTGPLTDYTWCLTCTNRAFRRGRPWGW